MKKIIVLLVAFIFTGIAANAQQATTQPKLPADARAKKIVESVDKIVTLQPAQKVRVQGITLDRVKLMDLNRQKSGNNPGQFDAEKNRIVAKWKNELSAILTPEQMAKFNKDTQQKIED
jgi:hypothetical protein